MVARKNKNKSPVVSSGRVTRSQGKDALLDESKKGGQKEVVKPAEETAKKGQKRRMSTRTSSIQKEADSPSVALNLIKKRAGAPAEYVAAPLKIMPGAPAEKVVQGKKGGKKKTVKEVKKTSKVVGKRKTEKCWEEEKKIQEVPSDEPSQDPTDESSTDSGDDSEESIYKVEAKPVSEEDDELEEEEKEEEINPKKKQAKKGKAQKLVKAKAEKGEQKLVVYDQGKSKGSGKVK
ncbi:nucleolin-like [Chenopodium quinoa]|uniref:nucleolin-like n=1 Tax=Chenopodium quinoa TaxID=63459 RepID=UPI000B781DAF|nr:nucleolin-like [Chenopodium quinoa]